MVFRKFLTLNYYTNWVTGKKYANRITKNNRTNCIDRGKFSRQRLENNAVDFQFITILCRYCN